MHHVKWDMLEQVPNVRGVKAIPQVSFSYLFDESTHVQRAEWGLLRWLNDYCIATAQGWSNLPGKHQQGEVPLKGINSRLIAGKISLHGFVFKL